MAARDKLVHIMGGASIIQQALVDELFLHVAPVILNSGTRLFEHLGGPIQLERAEVIESRHATHLRYRILNWHIGRAPGTHSAVGRRLGPALGSLQRAGSPQSVYPTLSTSGKPYKPFGSDATRPEQAGLVRQHRQVGDRLTSSASITANSGATRLGSYRTAARLLPRSVPPTPGGRVGLIAIVVEEYGLAVELFVDAVGFDLVDVDRRSGSFCELAVE